jgi:hypothetical protein
MSIRSTHSLCAMTIFAAALSLACGGAQAKSAVQKECSEKYQAAKAANTLGGQTYNQYYKQCAAEAKADKAGTTTPAATATPAAPTPAAPPPATPAAIPVKPVAPTTTTAAPARPPVVPAPSAAVGNAVFPTAISPSLASEKPGKARMETCLAQYKANKATNGNGGLKWIQKGGGYYSECNTRLKS